MGIENDVRAQLEDLHRYSSADSEAAKRFRAALTLLAEHAGRLEEHSERLEERVAQLERENEEPK